MDLDKRRQHVNRIVADLGEGGSHIPGVDQAVESTAPGNSFTFTPIKEENLYPENAETLQIPMGTPSLFEEAPADLSQEAIEQPSLLQPQEVLHQTEPIEAPEPQTLEDKFVQAINTSEPASAPTHESPTINPVAAEDAHGKEQVGISVNSLNNETTPQAESAAANPTHDHFPESTPSTTDHGADDAGLGSAMMARRHSLMSHEQRAE